MDLPTLSSRVSIINTSSDNSLNPAKDDNVLEALPVVTDAIDGGWYGKIATSVVMVFGTFGNLMTVIVLRSCRAGSLAMTLYLTALAVSDTMMLYSTALPMWARKVINFDMYVTHVLVCKGFIWVMQSSSVCSAWFLVVLTVQRAVSVVWPHRVNIVCTRRKSIIIIVTIAVVVCTIYLHTLYGYDIINFEDGKTTRCTFAFQSYQTFWLSVWVKVDVFLYCIFPVFFITLSNAVLVWKLAISVTEANLTFSGTKIEQKQSRKDKASSTTVTVIIVSVAFVLTAVPMMIYNTFVFEEASKDEDSRRFHYFLYDLLLIFSVSNFAWNFYLYCLTGRKFRREFLSILFSCCGYRSSIPTSRSTKEGKQFEGTAALQKKSFHSENNDDF